MSALEEKGTFDLTRRQFLGTATVAGALVVAAPVVTARRAEAAGAGGQVTVYVTINPDETVTIVCPNSEMGQGTSTALPQIVAEELDVPMASVHLIMGSTQVAPNPGATIASASIQIHAEPLRRAAGFTIR